MDEHQHDAAAIEDGLARILGRCIKKINRARRQEKRLKKYRDEDQEPPEDLKKEVRKRRNELRTSIEEVLNFQDAAVLVLCWYMPYPGTPSGNRIAFPEATTTLGYPSASSHRIREDESRFSGRSFFHLATPYEGDVTSHMVKPSRI
ncbi:uncharacterized protein LOC142592692 isoform X2 [Dermacentor variabilis]|uniref:uncharacterized protein LOC142592692 isoform X2 n=1 Tax=Dermacentor variabilis TaxID=34621 RepID=UPI003F5B1307